MSQPTTSVWQLTSARREGFVLLPRSSAQTRGHQRPCWTSEVVIPLSCVDRCNTILSAHSQCRGGVSLSVVWMKELCHHKLVQRFFLFVFKWQNNNCRERVKKVWIRVFFLSPWGFFGPSCIYKDLSEASLEAVCGNDVAKADLMQCCQHQIMLSKTR